MTDFLKPNSPVGDPIRALAEAEQDGVLALIIGVEGPSYRPLGAFMAVLAGGKRVGSLSSGCVEADIAIHAQEALDSAKPVICRYGRGSAALDIVLPCGGGLEILLLPRPERALLAQLSAARAARRPQSLIADIETGALHIAATGETGRNGATFCTRLTPDIMFYTFGKGPEASTFAGLVQAAGYPNLLLSPDTETLGFGTQAGCQTQHLLKPAFPAALSPDKYSAVVLFFHDHEWEPPILVAALDSPAFYIGAQGS
ncbi:MAG: XdhC family protein [Rhodobacteraceae bacterium]|nr:XdhC family protein [Paracoccaceae bacterium]